MHWQRQRYREADLRPRIWCPERIEDGSQAVEARVDIVAALGLLPPKHRGVIVLCDLQEQTPTEVARLLQVPPGTVRVRLQRAHDALRSALTRKTSKEDSTDG